MLDSFDDKEGDNREGEKKPGHRNWNQEFCAPPGVFEKLWDFEQNECRQRDPDNEGIQRGCRLRRKATGLFEGGA
jgi:hypothetical protein